MNSYILSPRFTDKLIAKGTVDEILAEVRTKLEELQASGPSGEQKISLHYRCVVLTTSKFSLKSQQGDQ